MKVISSPSASEAVTVPIAVWFSATVNVGDDTKTGFFVSRTMTVLVSVPTFRFESVAV